MLSSQLDKTNGIRRKDMFTDYEIEYLKSQPLARLATVADNGQPDVVPVGFEFDGEEFYIGGHNPRNTRKHKNVRTGHTRVALVVDDLASVKPWRPRGIRVYGSAELVEREGRFGFGEYMHILPRISWSWGFGEEGGPEGFAPRRAVHE
jgi:pyridoxamine 5'-phosphate oxidase family protein